METNDTLRTAPVSCITGPRGAPGGSLSGGSVPKSLEGRMQGRRWAAAGVALAASLLVAPSPGDARGVARPAVLASYSFDDDVATGPDTFAIWQGARHSKGGRGHVRLSSAFHVSGHRSVELEDVAGDSDFPELQGYFPVRRAGQLFFHFAFLTTDPGQELNIALAGPRSLPAREGRHRLLARDPRRPSGALLGQHPQAALRAGGVRLVRSGRHVRHRGGTLRSRDPCRGAGRAARVAARAAERGQPARFDGRQVLLRRRALQ